eukprot:jgi/Chlat1/7961/Chrsp69S07391
MVAACHAAAAAVAASRRHRPSAPRRPARAPGFLGDVSGTSPAAGAWRLPVRTLSRVLSMAASGEREGGLAPEYRVPQETAVVTERASALHDFCLTIPYGFIVAIGGLAGFIAKRSMASLAAGGGSGLLLWLLGSLSLKAWQAGRSSLPYTVAAQVIACALTYIMGTRWRAGGKFFPAGFVAIFSGLMVLFYAYNMLAGGNPKKKRKTSTE